MTRDPLCSSHTAIVFAQALTGLGHLRVTHALYHGLPSGAHSYLLNSQDESINTLHRLMSINPFMRRMMESAQSGWFEDAFAHIARRYFRSHTAILSRQLQTIVDEHMVKPKTLLVVATHTFLGHQIAAFKEEFARKNSITVVLVVVVTDDSPQHIWAVGGADIIFVPSERTKNNLERYHGSQRDMKHALYVVDPYMVSPRFGVTLPDDLWKRKVHALNPDKLAPIHMSVPVSGAAVQLSYVEHLMDALNRSSGRFVYHVVSHQSPSTLFFLNRMIGRGNVSLSVSTSHREVVDMYESLIQNHGIALEVTKPSEQAFKALCHPKTHGGVILLFSDPVGRQEKDNLLFLARHRLIPSRSEQRRMWTLSRLHRPIPSDLLEESRGWRGMLLPNRSSASAEFIRWSLEQRIFYSMMQFSGYKQTRELSANGVSQFWNQVNGYLQSVTI